MGPLPVSGMRSGEWGRGAQLLPCGGSPWAVLLMSTMPQAAHTFPCTCTCLQGLYTCTPHVHTHARLPRCACACMLWVHPYPHPCLHAHSHTHVHSMLVVISTLGTCRGPAPVPTRTCVEGEAMGSLSSQMEEVRNPLQDPGPTSVRQPPCPGSLPFTAPQASV